MVEVGRRIEVVDDGGIVAATTARDACFDDEQAAAHMEITSTTAAHLVTSSITAE